MKTRSQLMSQVPRCWLLLMLLLWAATATGPLLAQQPDAASMVKSNTTEQGEAATNVADPLADETAEAMFPHFKDTRFWLSGQGTSSSRLTLRSTRLTAARTALAPITRKPRRAC
jgi:hypothetical protein